MSTGTPGVTSIMRAWTPEDDLDAGQWTKQVTGAKRRAFDASDWREDLLAHLPFLSYRELGNLLSGAPSELRDALKSSVSGRSRRPRNGSPARGRSYLYPNAG